MKKRLEVSCYTGLVGFIVSLVLSAMPLVVNAADVKPKVAAKIIAKLKQARPDLNYSEDIKLSPISGLYKVVIEGGPAVYVTADGEYFIAGDIYKVDKTGIVNLSDQERNVDRASSLAKISMDEMVVFSPEGKRKAFVTVFTDVDCGYCRKLHQEVPKMNELGIEIRYMAFPRDYGRGGESSPSYQKIASAWCAEDPNDALTKLKNNQSIPIKVCNPNPVSEQYVLGAQLGVTGTPALVLESGELLPGYLKADVLAKKLGI